ncbi:MAG: organomercurial lyase [Planctomycetota bacterium]|jgi:thioredoxin 1
MNKMARIFVVAVVVISAAAVIAIKERNRSQGENTAAGTEDIPAASRTENAEAPKTLPRLVDLGATKCIPCKMMAPILEELKTEYAGILQVDFIDVWKNPDAGKEYGIKIIPTQIFFDASGKERFRHEGFFSKEDILAKWKELGVSLAPKVTNFSRLEPAVPDNRPKEKVCYMCDSTVNPKTRVTIKTDKGDVYLCCPHCYFITYSSLLEKQGIDEKSSVTGWASGEPLVATAAVYLYGMEESGRPTIKAFADRSGAVKERQISGGSILNWEGLKEKELATRCGFCDRAVYPEDAAQVKAVGVRTWGCCPMCALGVAARTGKDIGVYQKDALTGQMVRVKTTNGSVSLLEPDTAVAWAGKKKNSEGKIVSAGCFKQAFFVNQDNLKKWVDQNPTATGMMISINQALAAKMKLSPAQISKACKIGECAPK